jgi:hypothetical protein
VKRIPGLARAGTPEYAALLPGYDFNAFCLATQAWQMHATLRRFSGTRDSNSALKLGFKHQHA